MLEVNTSSIYEVYSKKKNYPKILTHLLATLLHTKPTLHFLPLGTRKHLTPGSLQSWPGCWTLRWTRPGFMSSVREATVMTGEEGRRLRNIIRINTDNIMNFTICWSNSVKRQTVQFYSNDSVKILSWRKSSGKHLNTFFGKTTPNIATFNVYIFAQWLDCVKKISRSL